MAITSPGEFFFLLSLSFFILNDVNRSTDALKVRRGSLGGQLQ